VVSPAPEQPRNLALQPVEPGAAAGNVSKAISIKGEITGREDLFIDGEVQGSIRITDGNVTVGPNVRVTADIEAREVVVRGKVKVAVHGRERVQIGRTGEVAGDIATRRLSVEEGAILSGQVDVARTEETRSSRSAGIATGTEAARPVPIRATEPQS
jgi:cytoskeletal protein CcmA (bactofilin family)